jgi:hypothetical protein
MANITTFSSLPLKYPQWSIYVNVPHWVDSACINNPQKYIILVDNIISANIHKGSGQAIIIFVLQLSYIMGFNKLCMYIITVCMLFMKIIILLNQDKHKYKFISNKNGLSTISN